MVLVDDLLPLNAQDQLLLPRSALKLELWPMIIAKAICKLARPALDLTTPTGGPKEREKKRRIKRSS